jgi:carboxyl-terminal processing protease
MMRYLGSLRWPARAGLCCLAAVAVTAATVSAARASGAAPAAQAASRPPACSQPNKQPPLRPTTVTTIGQAYYCIFAHYYSGPVLDDRVLLAGAFGGFVVELDKLGVDQPDATMPALTGNRDRDWAAFAAVYRRVIRKVPPRDVQQVAEATMTGMVAALNDNHARWDYPVQPPGAPPSDIYGLGINTSPAPGVAKYSTAKTLPPAFVASVDPRSPAARAGVRTGDVITAVDGAPPFTDGYLSPGPFYLLYQTYPQHQPVRITLRWPVTGATRTITITPASYKAPAQPLPAKLLDGDIGYVQIPGFDPGTAHQALAAVKNLEKKATLHGLILDLGGGGGASTEVQQLLGAFEHGTAYEYDCTVTGTCTPDYPDASTPLLHLPLAVLDNSNCVSGCEIFAGAVKDLHLGALIGARTAGIIAGAALSYVLDDGSLLSLPPRHELGADHEIINGIGVAPDYYIPVTPRDLATGHDPDIAKALALLKG